MTIHNLGSSIDYSGRTVRPDLDQALKGVLDLWMPSDTGLGEVIDRLQHLAACRAAGKDIEHGGFDPDRSRKFNAKRMLHLDRAAIGDMRAKGMSYRRIAEHFGCSVGAVHKYAMDRLSSRADAILRDAEE